MNGYAIVRWLHGSKWLGSDRELTQNGRPYGWSIPVPLIDKITA